MGGNSISSTSSGAGYGNDKVDQKALQECGVTFEKGTLYELKKESAFTYGKDGEARTEIYYEATLSSGSIMRFEKQNGAKVTEYDDGYGFEKLNNAEINGSNSNTKNYYMIGCTDSKIDVKNEPNDNRPGNKVYIANHEDGTKSNGNTVIGDDSDAVNKFNATATTVGNRIIHEEDNKLVTEDPVTKRKIEVSTADGKQKTYSHDGKQLKESYVKKYPNGKRTEDKAESKSESKYAKVAKLGSMFGPGVAQAVQDLLKE
jgi:hypothetical protein